MMGPMSGPLAVLQSRIGRPVREREILRVTGTILDPDVTHGRDQARREALIWARKRSGGQLPSAAASLDSFEHLSGGRTTLAARMRDEASDVWALRGDDPDKDVPGRTWTTEVTVGQRPNEAARLSLRLLVSSAEAELLIEHAVPGVVRQIAERCGLEADGQRLDSRPWRIGSEEDVERLVDLLQDSARRLPVFVLSGDERSADPDAPLIEAAIVAAKAIGIAHTVVLPARYTFRLSDEFGKLRSCYHGAVRVFRPGFDAAADPYEHRLFLGEAVRQDRARVIRELLRTAADESLRRMRLGHDVLPFAAVRAIALQDDQERQAQAGASDAEQLRAAQRRIDHLEDALAKATAEAENRFTLWDEEVTRAEAAEAQVRNAHARIAQLESHLKSQAGAGDTSAASEPSSWSDLAEWCDQALVNRLILTPAARRASRSPQFADLPLVIRCLNWLAHTCRERRINGGGSISNATIEPGVENAPCGGDTFTFDFHGRRFAADWHVKNGGNTRDPSRCLRIYYAWDDATSQIIVAELPAHRTTGAS